MPKFKFKVGDVIIDKKATSESCKLYKIRGISKADESYDAAFCDKDGNLTKGSIDIFLDGMSDEGYAVEEDFELFNKQLS